MMKGLTLNQTEQARLATLNMVLEKQITVEGAAYILGLSERHTWRILEAYRQKGAAGIAHGNRGQAPPNVTPKEVKDKIVLLARTTYIGFNRTHFTEMLSEREGVKLSRSTVRNILLNAGIKSQRNRRPPKYRCRRPRMSHEGMLIQMDGSYHDWLEGRGPWLSLLLAVDDATGTVPYAIFREQEDTGGYFMLMEGIIRHHGIPMAVSTDRHSVFKHPSSSFTGDDSLKCSWPTQFTRAMKELGISMIVAHSPQAKGRIEKMANTFQDRLVSELRLNGVSNMEEANRFLVSFLPKFNDHFGVSPLKAETVYRPVDPMLNLFAILCNRFSHKVSRDNVIKHRGQVLQLLADRTHSSYAGLRVELRQYPDGRLEVFRGDISVNIRELPQTLRYFGSSEGQRDHEYGSMPEWLEGVIKQREEKNKRTKSASRVKALRGPTPRQQALWDAVQAAKKQGLSKRAMARTLRISRNTVKKYFSAISPPITRLGSLAQVSGTVISR